MVGGRFGVSRDGVELPGFDAILQRLRFLTEEDGRGFSTRVHQKARKVLLSLAQLREGGGCRPDAAGVSGIPTK